MYIMKEFTAVGSLCNMCGIRNRDTYDNEFAPTLKSTDRQFQDRTCQGDRSPRQSEWKGPTTPPQQYPDTRGGTPSLWSRYLCLTR